MVELCKERTGLLLDPNAAGGSSTWHTNTVAINGLPQGKGWPSAEDLLGALRARPGASVSIAEIEEDCDRLAASGLFRTARPRISPPGAICASRSSFWQRIDLALSAAPPAAERIRPLPSLLLYSQSRRCCCC